MQGPEKETETESTEALDDDHLDEEEFDEEDLDEEESEEEDGYDEQLSIAQVSELSRCRPSSCVAVIGEAGSGKTTLLLMLYQIFLSAPLGDFSFVDTETIQAYERHIQGIRAVSPETKRTIDRTQIEDEVSFLHLVLSKENEKRNLFFSNVSGEVFLRTKSAPEEAEADLGWMNQCHHVILLLDGQKLNDKQERHSVKSTGVGLLETYIQAKILHKNVKLLIVVSKSDCLTLEGSEKFIQGINELFQHKFGQNYQVDFLEIAVLPEKMEREASFQRGKQSLLDILSILWEDTRDIPLETQTAKLSYQGINGYKEKKS